FADQRDDLPHTPRRRLEGAISHRPRGADARVRAEPRRVRGDPRQGSPTHDGPRRPSILRAADPAVLLRRRAQQQRQRRARVLSARVPARDGEGDGAPGAPRAGPVMAEIVAAMAMTHSPGLTGWFTRASQEYQQLALQANAEMRRRLEGGRPAGVGVVCHEALPNWPTNTRPA